MGCPSLSLHSSSSVCFVSFLFFSFPILHNFIPHNRPIYKWANNWIWPNRVFSIVGRIRTNGRWPVKTCVTEDGGILPLPSWLTTPDEPAAATLKRKTVPCCGCSGILTMSSGNCRLWNWPGISTQSYTHTQVQSLSFSLLFSSDRFSSPITVSHLL